jgi:trehalose-6-phosphate synthase
MQDMQLVSYRGPSMAGGVSGAFSSLWNCMMPEMDSWCYMDGAAITQMSRRGESVIDSMPQYIIDGHYNFCNSFIWPVMHDMPERVDYIAHDRALYREFNRLLADAIKTARKPRAQFVQDYQLALIPGLIASSGYPSMIFWHIPWPKHVAAMHVPPIVELVRSMIKCDVVGFHTAEYADNFRQFAMAHIPELRNGRLSMPQLAVRPLGINNDSWSLNAAAKMHLFDTPQLVGLDRKQIILSVERADYTKGVLERMDAIRAFFNKYEHLRDKVSFVQVCGKTRPGLRHFDAYWKELEAAEAALRVEFDLDKNGVNGEFRPLVWLKDPLKPTHLSLLYRDAAAMLVNPIRDGLNLTAKEFVLTQTKNAAPLLLSRGAGSFEEMGRYSLEVKPDSPGQVAHTINRALAMGDAEKRYRHRKLVRAMESNTLQDWWMSFVEDRQLAVKRS